VLELVEGVERLGVRAGCGEHVFEHPGNRDTRPLHRVDQLGGGGVAGGDEAVLGKRLTGAHVGRRGEALLELEPRKRLDQRRECGGGDQPGLGIHDPHPDGAQPGLGTDVPPQEGGLGDGARAHEQIDGPDPVRVAVEGPGDAGARKALEQDRAVGGQAGGASA